MMPLLAVGVDTCDQGIESRPPGLRVSFRILAETPFSVSHREGLGSEGGCEWGLVLFKFADSMNTGNDLRHLIEGWRDFRHRK